MAAGCNDRSGTAALAGRLNETLKLLAGLTGELLRLNPHTVNHNVTVFMSSPLYIELEQMLIATLSDHPDCSQRWSTACASWRTAHRIRNTPRPRWRARP